MCVPSFNHLGLTVPEKNVTKNFNVWKLERKKSEEIKGRISSTSLISVNTIHLPTVHVCTKFQSSRPHSSWEKCDERFQCSKIGEKEKWRNKGTNRQQQPDSGIHDTSVHCPHVDQVSIFYEKGMTKNFTESQAGSQNHRMAEWQNHRMTELQGKSSMAPTFTKRGYKYRVESCNFR